MTETIQNHSGGVKRKRIMVDVPCEKCGEIRSLPKHNPHPPLCRRCSYESRSLGPPVKLTCVGYKPYGARVAVFATNCPHETEKPRKTLNDYQRKSDDAQHAFIDAERGLYRCKWCSGALFLIYKLEGDVRKFLKRAQPNLTPPKIQSLEQLHELRRVCSKLNYQDDTGATVVFDPHAFKRGDGKTSKWGPRQDSIAQATGLLIKRSRDANVVKGLCQFCGKIVFSNHEGRASKVHMKCYQSQSGFRKGIPPGIPSRGRPVELENLRRHYSWAIRHKLGGESLGSIAQEFGVAKQTIDEAISKIVGYLPPSDLVPKQFRDRISRLKPLESI